MRLASLGAEFDSMEPLNVLMFYVGLAITLSGVYMLSQREMKVSARAKQRKLLQPPTFTTKLTHPIRLARFTRFAGPSLKMRFVSLRSAQLLKPIQRFRAQVFVLIFIHRTRKFVELRNAVLRAKMQIEIEVSERASEILRASLDEESSSESRELLLTNPLNSFDSLVLLLLHSKCASLRSAQNEDLAIEAAQRQQQQQPVGVGALDLAGLPGMMPDDLGGRVPAPGSVRSRNNSHDNHNAVSR